MTPKTKSRSSRSVKAIAYQYQIGTILAGFRMQGKNLTANIDKYYQEANAVKISGGRFLRAAYCFGSFLKQRCSNTPRLYRMLLEFVSN